MITASLVYPDPIPLGVSDLDGRIGAISATTSGIDLLDLSTGTQMRHLPEIGCPLMIDGLYLIGWRRDAPTASALRLFRAALPPQNVRLHWSPSFDLPERARPEPGTELSLEIRLARSGDRYLVHWKVRPNPTGGPPRPLPYPGGAAGLEVDIRTLEPLAPFDGRIFNQTDLERRGERLAREAGGFVYWQAGQLRNAPWATPAGERFLRTLGTPGENHQRLSIARPNHPEARSLAEFEAEDLDSTAPELSLDGRHLAAVCHSNGEIYWHVYSTETGQLTTRVPYRSGFDSFRIFDRRLICLEETKTPDRDNFTVRVTRALHAVAVDDGKMLWSYALPTSMIADSSFLPPPPF
jgi:hypothetical protein